jgi:transposase
MGQVLHGPCGYGVHRQLTSLGHWCDMVAPSLIPTKAGDCVKTNRRDATMLTRLHRAGELTPVWVPDADHEPMRDLIWLRSIVRRIVTQGIRGIGENFSVVLVREVLYRPFGNRKQLASYVGLAPMPHQSGSMDRDRRIGRAGNARARRTLVPFGSVSVSASCRAEPVGSRLSRWLANC